MTEPLPIGAIERANAAGLAAADVIDRTVRCLDCGTPFLLTCNEQIYYRERGYREPGRCPACRATKRAERNAPLLAAHDTHEAGNAPESVYGGAGSHDGRKGRAILYPAVCASCGKETQVPFLPRGDRPVYCRECFGQRRGRR